MTDSNKIPLAVSVTSLGVAGLAAGWVYSNINDINSNIEIHEKVLCKVVKKIEGFDRKIENVTDDTSKYTRDFNDDIQELRVMCEKLIHKTNSMRRDIDHLIKKIDGANTDGSKEKVIIIDESNDTSDTSEEIEYISRSRSNKSSRRSKQKDKKKKKRRDEKSYNSDDSSSLDDIDDVMNRLVKK